MHLCIWFFPLKKISSLSFHFIAAFPPSRRHLAHTDVSPLLQADVFAVCISTVKDGFNNLSSNQQLKLQTGTSCVCMDKVGHFYWSIKAGSSGGADGAHVWKEVWVLLLILYCSYRIKVSYRIKNIESCGKPVFLMTVNHLSCVITANTSWMS